MLRESRLVAVGVDADGPTPVLLLQELDRADRLLPLWVGLPEAAAVAQAWREERPPRPTAHQLLVAAVTAFGRRLQQVRIVALIGSVFHAELVFDGATVVSARPSDALTLALHAGVPVLVDDAVLDEVAVPADRVLAEGEPSDGPAVPEDDVARFRRFLDEVDPEDFS